MPYLTKIKRKCFFHKCFLRKQRFKIKVLKQFWKVHPFKDNYSTKGSDWSGISSISSNLSDKAWFPPMRLIYSHKDKLISLMRLLFYRIKIFNLMHSHQVSQISHFWIKYEYSVFHLKEKISHHVFCSCLSLYTLFCLCHKGRGIIISSPQSIFFQIQFNHIPKTTRIYLDHHFIVCLNFNSYTAVTFFLYYLIRPKSLPNIICSFIFDQMSYIKSSRCFGGLSLISIILMRTLWE